MKGNLLDAIDMVKNQMPNFTDKLLKEFHNSLEQEIEKRENKIGKKARDLSESDGGEIPLFPTLIKWKN